MSDIPALIAESRQLTQQEGPFSLIRDLTDALEAEHARAERLEQKLFDQGSQAQARIAALEAALEPFAEASKFMASSKEMNIWGFLKPNGESVRITIADAQNARTVLEKE